jgi:hypothetical protein
MSVRIESSFLRAAIGFAVFVALLAFFLFFMSPVMKSADAGAKAAYLFFAGPAGAMITHLHVPLFALLVLLLSPFVIAASVSQRRRKLMLLLSVGLWFLLGAMFASIPLS